MPAEVKKEIQLEIAHVFFTDIVRYSKLPVNKQREESQRFFSDGTLGAALWSRRFGVETRSQNDEIRMTKQIRITKFEMALASQPGLRH
jgi:hypothetical protein